jgi:hypothetical protein
MNRNELRVLARLLNIDHSTYANDSNLEQAILYKMKTTPAASDAVYLAIPSIAGQTLHGAANV